MDHEVALSRTAVGAAAPVVTKLPVRVHADTHPLFGGQRPNKDAAGPAYSSTQPSSTLPWGATLVSKSGFIPRIIGVLLMIGCFGYLVDFVTFFLFPDSGVEISQFTFIGELLLPLWLLIRGVNVERWEKRAREPA